MTFRGIKGLALASLSGESDADWALRRQEWVECAFLGGLALDVKTQKAARSMMNRGRKEFLPENPFHWIEREFSKLQDSGVRPAINVRTTSSVPLQRAAQIVSSFSGILEINAHCRQPEMIEAGCGHALLRDPDRLWNYVETAAKEGVTVSLKGRFEVPGVNSVDVMNEAVDRGIDVLHVDTMDSTAKLNEVEAPTLIANNGIRRPENVRRVARHDVDYVSVARGDSPEILKSLKRYIKFGQNSELISSQ